MSDALQLVEQIRSDLKPLETKISSHPYLRVLEDGRVQRDSLKVFAGQQHHIISSDLRSIALILSRQGCGRMRKALHEKYGIAPSSLTFFDLFANMPSFEQEALGIIQNSLDRGVSARLIHRATRMLQNYELMFWDAIAGAAGVPLDRGE